jgi:hypothetical protein
LFATRHPSQYYTNQEKFRLLWGWREREREREREEERRRERGEKKALCAICAYRI